MLKSISSLLAMLLLTAVPLARLDVSPMVAAHERPAGCHQNGSVPVPQPVSYRCCQGGHDSAILQASTISQLDSAALTPTGESTQILMSSFTHDSLRNLATSSADPPASTPLRV